MVTVADVREAFDDLGFTLEDPKVVDRLTSLCDIYGIDETKLSCEYLAFASRKKLDASSGPTMDILDAFDQESLKMFGSKKADKTGGGKTYDSSTLPVNDDDEEEDDGGDALSYYGNTPNKSKRQITPDNSAIKRRGLTSSQTTFSPTSYKEAATPTSSSGGRKYSERTNAGQVLIRHGNTASASVWKQGGTIRDPEVTWINEHGREELGYKYMFERLREKAGHLDEIICRLGEDLAAKHGLDDPVDFLHPIPGTFTALGRICCDSEGRLNAQSVLLQGSQDLCRGRSLPLDTSKAKEYSLFPGQVVMAQVTNPNGSRLMADKFWSDAATGAEVTKKSKVRLAPEDKLQVVVACGPYTTGDNLLYEPLSDLLSYVAANRPHVVFLCGPFVDAKHSMICEPNNNESFDAIFGRVMKMVADGVADLDHTHVVVVPSTRDVHHRFVYPTPPFPESRSSQRLHMVSDPAMVSVEGVLFGITSTDVLFHLGKEEISYPPRSGDRLRRLATHLLQQKNFYPLYPPSEEVNVDYERLEAVAQLDQVPHVLITPSDLLQFFKDIDGCLVVNPQRLTKGSESGGVFARFCIQGSVKDEALSPKNMMAEIVRI